MMKKITRKNLTNPKWFLICAYLKQTSNNENNNNIVTATWVHDAAIPMIYKLINNL